MTLVLAHEPNDTSDVTLSQIELYRLALDVLRVKGMPLGMEQRAARAMVWLQAVHGAGVDVLLSTERFWPANEIDRPRWRPAGPGRCFVDARGLDLCSVGPMALDLVFSARDGSGSAIGLVTGTRTMALAGELAEAVAARGVAGAVIYSGAADDPFPGDGVVGTVAAHQWADQRDGGAIFAGGLDGWACPLPEFAARFGFDRPDIDEADARGWLVLLLEPDQDRLASRLADVGLDCDPRREGQPHDWRLVTDFAVRRASALANGTAVSRVAFDKLATLAAGIRVPSSATSRDQAG